ncbi:MAG: HD domain-containing protein [Bdellovibrionales bacterium]
MQSLEQWQKIFERTLRDFPTEDGSHDISHFQRVWRLAQKFSDPHHDLLVVLAACYFHDIVSYPKDDPRRSRSSVDAAERAVSILSSLDFPEEKLENVRHCIEAHSFSANIPTETPEAGVVQDADRMEALGAIGLARTFYVSGLMRRRLFCPEDPFAKNRPLDDQKFAIDHFHQKLFKLPLTMRTAAGRNEAARRAKVLTRFLEDLANELAP